MTVEALSSTADIEEARARLVQSVHGLPEAALSEANVVGRWSIGECLAHILAWDAWGTQAFAALERGESPPAPDEATMNRAAVARYAGAPAEDFLRALQETHRGLVARLAAMTDEERMEPRYQFAGRAVSANEFMDGFMDHDLEHASQIRAWRKARR